MKGQYLLIWIHSDGENMNLSWHKSEADALESILNTLPGEWVIIGVGDDGTQRDSNEHPVVIRSSSGDAKT